MKENYLTLSVEDSRKNTNRFQNLLYIALKSGTSKAIFSQN